MGLLTVTVSAACSTLEAPVPVFARNPCDRQLWVRLSYEESRTLVAGGDESIAFAAAPGSTTRGPHEIGVADPETSILFLEVFAGPSYRRRVAARSYDEVPRRHGEAEEAVALEIPYSACTGKVDN